MSDGDPNPLLDPGPFGLVYIQDTLINCTLIVTINCSKI